MKSYISIPKLIDKNSHIYLFQKFDGSQIRAEFNSKKGFYKFGTKNQLIDVNTKPFNKAIPLIINKYQESIAEIAQKNKWRDAVFFFEFFGPSSFAGSHDFAEEQDVVLFDANPYKKGILPPDEFINIFKYVEIPKVLFQGYLTDEIIESVRNSTLKDMPYEGVIAKGANISPGLPLMFKIKSKNWLNKLKDHCKDNEKLFNDLA